MTSTYSFHDPPSLQTLMIHCAEDPVYILLFLAGEEEIEEARQRIKLEADDLLNTDPSSVGPLVCVPLYSSPAYLR